MLWLLHDTCNFVYFADTTLWLVSYGSDVTISGYCSVNIKKGMHTCEYICVCMCVCGGGGGGGEGRERDNKIGSG